MRNKTILLLCSALLSGSLSLSLLGCGGCASTQPRSGAASPSFQGIEILPEEKELSPAAKDTYAYLLYMQALADEDEELLLQAAQQMTGGTLPAKAWLEGALWLDSRRSEKVLPLLELGLQVWPDDLPLNLFSAEALAAHGKTEQGLKQIQAFVARHPDSLDARMELILLLVKAKRFDEAEKHIGSIAAGERTPMVDYYHARALIGMQRRAEAIPLLQKAIQAMPDFVEALVELAYAYEQQKQWNEARTIYEKLLKLQVSEQDVCLRLVHLSLRLNQPEKALKYFRKGPDAAAFKLTAISMFLESRHYLQAERLLKEMLDEPGVPPDVFLMLAGIARDQRRDTELALSWLARIPASSPTAVQAEGLKAQILADAGKEKEAVPSTVHCDHLIQAYKGAKEDILTATKTNEEVYDFLRDVSSRYGIGFWKPGAGIIHQVVLENYAFPGGMMVGTDSHTPNAGGLGMVAIGVGGADAVDVMTGMEWELKMPKIIGVRLIGKLNGWTSPKDVILKLAGILTVKGGTNAIIEYFGPGTESLSATGKATICNMGAEVGATTSLFPFDGRMATYLRATGRDRIVDLAESVEADLRADEVVTDEPLKYYDRVIEIDLSELEPYINGPFTPDAATPISEFAEKVLLNGYPRKMEVGLIGSCTNSSYQDLSRAASLAKQVAEKKLSVASPLIVNPGSEQIRATAERDGMIETFEQIGATIMANACGPCIGQWKRHTDDPTRKNSIVTSFNRNFAKRADGNPNTYAFVASPELTMALTIAGDLCFNPLKDRLVNHDGEKVKLSEPVGDELPMRGFTPGNVGYIAPGGAKTEIKVKSDSQRLQLLTPFPAWDGTDLLNMPLLIKAQGKCTTDHISMAGPWLRFRGHLENISDNMLMGAVNVFNGETNKVWNRSTNTYGTVSGTAKMYKSEGISSIVVAEENYGEGSSREHAAMEPRFLNVRVILAKSFARIHETNLKKQGMLAITFVDKADYDKIQEHDMLSVTGLVDFMPGHNLTVVLHHEDGTKESFEVQHTYNEQQIGWFRAGSALNAR